MAAAGSLPGDTPVPSLFDATPEGLLLLAPDGTVLQRNATARETLGGAGELTGNSIFKIVAPEYVEAFGQFHASVCAGRQGIFECDMLRDGQRRRVEFRAAPLAYNGFNASLAVCRDVTSRTRAERDSLLLSAIVESSDDAIVSKDLNGVITSWNKSAERLFGYTAREALGQSVASLLIPDDRQAEEPAILARLRNGERVEHFETVRKCKDGRLLEISLTISPVKDTTGRVIGASKIARDITERRKAERDIADLNGQLRVDLAAMTWMQRLATRMVQTEEFAPLLQEIVSAGLEITGAQMGCIQLLDGGHWKLVAQQGLASPFLDWLQNAPPRNARLVVENLAAAELSGRRALQEAGVQALQVTPLFSRAGQLLGRFATCHRQVHGASERELRLLDLLARQAADLIQTQRDFTALLESEARFRQLANSMPQIVWSSGSGGAVDYYNDRWYEFTGLPPQQAAEEATELIHPEDRGPVKEAWRQAMASGTPFSHELRLWDRAAGQWRWFISRAVPVRNAAGEVTRWYGSSTDIDAQKHVEAELRRANQDLEQFAFSASHDLQEPLRSVKIYSQLLASRYAHRLDGQALEFLTYLRTGASRMEMLVNDLLAYTRVTTLTEPPEAVNAEEILTQVLDNLAGAIAESGATITASPLPSLHMHASQMQQLLQNLIGNAIKYRSPHRAPLIEIGATLDQETWTFWVQDNGIGIEPQFLKGIFGLFKRLHTEKEYAGSGIGLAICQRIVDRYNGKIWVESTPGEGSKFLFTLPA
ncbi:MAG: PAS domain S-box protein [Bryobacterales bacterium]|nr:PAS domain S-box protein [Bryobacterales bacterium]